MSLSVDSDRVQAGLGDVCVDDVWNTPRSCRNISVESRLSPHHVNHVVSVSMSQVANSHRVNNRSVALLTAATQHSDVDATKRLTSFSVADILGPRYGSSPHRHHHQQQQQQQQAGGVTDDCSDDAESTSTRSNDDLSSSVLSHTSSTDGPSPTGSDRSHCWAENEPQLSTSRKLCCIMSSCLMCLRIDGCTSKVQIFICI